MTSELKGLIEAAAAAQASDGGVALGAARAAFALVASGPRVDAHDIGALLGLEQLWASCLGDDLSRSMSGLAGRGDAALFHRVGRSLSARGEHRIAAGLLRWASQLEPTNAEICAHHVGALERSGAHTDAIAALQRRHESLADRFDLRYLEAFNTLMAGDVAGAGELSSALDDGSTSAERERAASLRGMVVRAEVLTRASMLSDQSLLGWHLVMTGGVVLRAAAREYGRGAFNGRFGVHEDGPPVALEALRKLAYLTGVLDVPVSNIMFFPDWASAVLAHALGKVYGKMPRALSLPTELPGVIVVYDMERLRADQQALLAERKPGQILWNHAARYTREHAVAGDFTTVLCRENKAPWTPGVDGTVDGVNSPFDLADGVSNATLYDEALADLPNIIRVCREVVSNAGPDGPSFVRESGRRERQRIASPVARPSPE